MSKNYGLDWKKELAEQSEEDWLSGATSPKGIVNIPLAVKESFLPTGRKQGGVWDTQACATFSPTNGYDAMVEYLYQTTMTPENKEFFDKNGYRKSGKMDSSDAFNAILSGTTRQGNSLKAPLDSIRKNGMIPNWMMPLEPSMTWDEFHNPNRITKEMIELGQECASRIIFAYERVYENDFSLWLETDFIDVGGYAWPIPVDGIYPRTENAPNHAFLLWKPKYFANDSYPETGGDYIKQLAPDYIFENTGYRVYIAKQTTPEERKIQEQVGMTLCNFGLLSFFYDWWYKFISGLRGIIDPSSLGAQRSGQWTQASRAYRAEQPLCIFGMHKPTLLNPLNTHHVEDFSTHPEKEMLKSNWENVCRFHHLYHCHLGAWKSINPNVRSDAEAYTLQVKNRP